jgi:hypothetical protein
MLPSFVWIGCGAGAEDDARLVWGAQRSKPRASILVVDRSFLNQKMKLKAPQCAISLDRT